MPSSQTARSIVVTPLAAATRSISSRVMSRMKPAATRFSRAVASSVQAQAPPYPAAAPRAERRRRLLVGAETRDGQVLGHDLHLLGHPRRHEDRHRLVDDLVRDDRVALLDRVAEEGRPRDALDLKGHALHARLGLLGPADHLLRLDLQRRGKPSPPPAPPPTPPPA